MKKLFKSHDMYDVGMYYTQPIPEILCVKNVSAIKVKKLASFFNENSNYGRESLLEI